MKLDNTYKIINKNHYKTLVEDIKTKATENIKTVLKNIYTHEIEKVDESSKKYQQIRKSILKDPTTKWTADKEYLCGALVSLEIANDLILEKYKQAVESLKRNNFDFDVSIKFYKYKESLYFTYFSDMQMRNIFDFLVNDKRVVDFHSINKVNSNNYISNKNWNPIIVGEIVLCDVCMFYEFTPYNEMIRNIYKNIGES
jgi:hypothetical protein